MVIVDECHHVSAVSFEQILKYANARFVYGLTATPTRKDGLQPIIFMQCGPIRYTADAKTQMQSQTFQRLLVPRFTPFRLQTKEEETFTQVAGFLACAAISLMMVAMSTTSTVPYLLAVHDFYHYWADNEKSQRNVWLSEKYSVNLHHKTANR